MPRFIKRGRKGRAVFPFLRDIACANCGAVYALEPYDEFMVGERVTRTGMLDISGREVVHKIMVVVSTCPECGAPCEIHQDTGENDVVA